MPTKIVNQIPIKKKHRLVTDKALFNSAIKALKYAYAPYSKFKVGAAVLLSDQTIQLGANIENASYPLCLCAERTALSHAHMVNPRAKILAIAVVCKNHSHDLVEPGYPCGACRQVISEFEFKQKSPIRIIVGTLNKKLMQRFDGIQALLPYSFSGSVLE
ncbi:MAG: cytidine deaminase [Saprospiraceae bacterium]